jgi:uncharacterized membrane protein YphA (DoxX/SURF4 family)
MHIGLWIIQGLLAFAFFGAGAMKLATPVDQLAAQMAWVTHVPAAGVKLIGLAEVLGAIGLILPSVLRFRPRLTPLAASGLALTMLGAVVTHIAIGEPAMTVPPLVLGGLAGVVAWGRSKAHPIAAK